MKKTLIAFVLVLALALGGTGVLAHRLNTASESVTFRQTGTLADLTEFNPFIPVSSDPLAGTDAAAADLRVNLDISCMDRMFWHMELTPGMQPDTEFELAAKRRLPEWPKNSRVIDAWCSGSFGSTSTGDIDLDDKAMTNGYGELFKAVAPNIPAGETRTQVLPLRDYFTEWPLTIQSSLAGPTINTQDWTEEAAVGGGDDARRGWLHVKQLEQWFRFPIQGDPTMEVTVTRSADGAITELEGSLREGELYLTMPQVLANGRLYFIPDARDQKTWALADYSLTPHGFGLYSLPDYEPGGEPAESDLQFHRALPEEEVPLLLQADPFTGALVLITQQGGTGESDQGGVLTLNVLNMQGELLQSLPVAKDEGWADMIIREDWAVLFLDNSFTLLRRQADGLWQADYSHPLPWKGRFADRIRQAAGEDTLAVALSGDRLALAAASGKYSAHKESGYQLLIYDREGLVYAGLFDTTLRQPTQGRQDHNCIVQPRSLALHWAEE